MKNRGGFTFVREGCATGMIDCPNGDDAITVIFTGHSMTSCIPIPTPTAPLCDNCGERHFDLSGGDPEGDPGCDWDAMSGYPPRNEGHPADDPRHLTSDRIGFSVLS